jgi:hypothetical protein
VRSRVADLSGMGLMCTPATPSRGLAAGPPASLVEAVRGTLL